VEELLSKTEISELLRVHPRSVVLEAIRRGLKALREEILARKESSPLDERLFSLDRLLPLFQQQISLQVRPRLRRVINATGVVIHTNLGRSPLHPSAVQHIIDVSATYSNLEFDLELGERGSRYAHVEEILCKLSGAESAMVVNNNAGAVMLVLNTMAEGREVIVSRGELVEIGGAFRIPDVMRRSGALLKEVGTTNRTHPRDYQDAIGSQTALLLKVHSSNFRMLGFTSDVSLPELVKLARQHDLPVMNDLGSGCLIDLTPYGLEKEPTVKEAIQTGVDVITFSGDKLLGGPQAGIIVGKKTSLDLIKANPLTRALRIDKLTLAALESTLLLYLDEKRAVQELPTLRMLTYDRPSLRKRGARLLRRLRGLLGDSASPVLKEDISRVGGGAYPVQELPTIVLAIKPHHAAVNDLEQRLRKGDPPVICRISNDELVFDLRTIFDDEIPLLVSAIERVFAGLKVG
jgi:L-seryl-tRNA(Ser) seleniumtransferase